MYDKFIYMEQDRIKEIDRILVGFTDGLNVKEWHVPNCIDKETLIKMRYFETMPQYLTTAESYMNNEEKLFLKPAACLPIYPQIKRYNIVNEIITTMTNVYRYDNFDGKNHFWEFTVREFVLVGTEDYVMVTLEKILEKTIVFLLNRNLKTITQVSSDHFYSSAKNRMLGRFQKANRLKREIICKCKNEDIILGSVNYHGIHFSKMFGFDDNEKIVTGCIGFGIERWYRLWNMIESEKKL